MTVLLQPLPTDAGDAGPLARQLGRLLGPAYQAPDESLTAADLLAIARGLADGRATTLGSLDEAFPDATVSLLSEWEAMLALPDGKGRGDAMRHLLLLAQWRTRFAGTSQAIVAALTPLNNGTPPLLRESLARDSAANPRWVFVFTVQVVWSITDAASLAPMRRVLAAMTPAHTVFQFTSKPMTGFFCDVALCDNTVL